MEILIVILSILFLCSSQCFSFKYCYINKNAFIRGINQFNLINTIGISIIKNFLNDDNINTCLFFTHYFVDRSYNKHLANMIELLAFLMLLMQSREIISTDVMISCEEND